MKLCLLDTETTGFSHKTQDIIQIGGIIRDNSHILEEFNLKCQPIYWNNISPQALQVNNHTVEELRTYEHPSEIWKKFYKIITTHFLGEKYIFVAQNVPFDWRFLGFWWNRHKDPLAPPFEYYFQNENLDLMDITKIFRANKLLDVPNIKLGTIIEALDIKIEDDLHDAFADVKGTDQSIIKLLTEVARFKKENLHESIVLRFEKWLEILN
jgi:DNA polymerase-3 subunit alpha (Gram-positive type)